MTAKEPALKIGCRLFFVINVMGFADHTFPGFICAKQPLAVTRRQTSLIWNEEW
jgi:hypothetical protein